MVLSRIVVIMAMWVSPRRLECGQRRRLVCRAASTTESVSVRSRTASTAAEAVAAEDVEDDVEYGHDDLTPA